LSKYDTTYALKDKNIYKNVCIGYPFNFNSIYRSKEFLFGKIFDSIKNKTQIFLKDINYYREMIHPSMVVAESIKNSDNFNDFIIGSGRVIFIYDFIKKLYDKFNMDFKKYVVIDRQDSSMYRKNIYYNDTYNELYTEKYLFDIITKELEQ
jgi:GDP-D-mannose dehydratase